MGVGEKDRMNEGLNNGEEAYNERNLEPQTLNNFNDVMTIDPMTNDLMTNDY